MVMPLMLYNLNNMKFKKSAKIVTDDFYYDLTDGGYIKPEKLLENKSDADKVLEAIKVLEDFKRSAEDQDVIEYM